jgi:hypothetical protein
VLAFAVLRTVERCNESEIIDCSSGKLADFKEHELVRCVARRSRITTKNPQTCHAAPDAASMLFLSAPKSARPFAQV